VLFWPIGVPADYLTTGPISLVDSANHFCRLLFILMLGTKTFLSHRLHKKTINGVIKRRSVETLLLSSEKFYSQSFRGLEWQWTCYVIGSFRPALDTMGRKSVLTFSDFSQLQSYLLILWKCKKMLQRWHDQALPFYWNWPLIFMTYTGRYICT
jgi:hypothetical protein